MMDKTAWYLVGSIIAVAVCIVIVISYLSSEEKVKKHPMFASVKYKKLSQESETRKRLEKAAELFAEVSS
jgi:cell division septation protein DedD